MKSPFPLPDSPRCERHVPSGLRSRYGFLNLHESQRFKPTWETQTRDVGEAQPGTAMREAIKKVDNLLSQKFCFGQTRSSQGHLFGIVGEDSAKQQKTMGPAAGHAARRVRPRACRGGMIPVDPRTALGTGEKVVRRRMTDPQKELSDTNLGNTAMRDQLIHREAVISDPIPTHDNSRGDV